MTQAFLLPSGLTAATAPKPVKRTGRLDFKLLHSDTAEDLMRKVPEELWSDCTTVVAILVTIGWGFIETVQEIARDLHLCEGKQINRNINEIRRNFEQITRYSSRWRDFDEEAADWVYGQLAEDFRHLYDSLFNLMARHVKDPESRRLIIAVYQAAAVGNVVHIYAEHVCRQYARYGVDYAPEAIYGSHYDKAVRLSMIYAALVEGSDIIAREGRANELSDLSANIIAKRIIKGNFGQELYKLFFKHFPERQYAIMTCEDPVNSVSTAR